MVLWGAGAAQRVAVAVAVGALGVVVAAVVRRRAEVALVEAERVGAAAVGVAALGTAATALRRRRGEGGGEGEKGVGGGAGGVRGGGFGGAVSIHRPARVVEVAAVLAAVV